MAAGRVDVMTPVYNGAPYVRAAIESLQRQTYANIRIIVVNDGSTDATQSILDALAAHDDRIVVATQTHRGVVDTRNIQLAAATADLISLQDADDISEPDRIRKQVDYLAMHPDCVAVSGAARHIDADGRPTGHVVRFRPPEDANPMWVPSREPNLMPFTVMKRTAVQAAGGFRHAFHSDDSDLYWRLRRIGRLFNLPDIVGSYRVHAASDTGSSILTTRISALTDQLSAVSAARAEWGVSDLVFERDRYAEYRAAGTMQGIYELACRDLAREEADHLRMAYAAKVLQLLELRDQVPSPDDCRFIYDAYARRPALNPTNERELRRLFGVIGARLILKRAIRQARALLPTRHVPEAFARAALGRH